MQREANARGEFYTPREVSLILNAVIHATVGRPDSVYDPACGTGSLLAGIDADGYFGQEINPETAALCRGGREREIRKSLAHWLQSVVRLPGNIFLITSISVDLVVMGQGLGKVLFADTSNEFEKRPKQNRVLPERIIGVLSDRREVYLAG